MRQVAHTGRRDPLVDWWNIYCTAIST